MKPGWIGLTLLAVVFISACDSPQVAPTPVVLRGAAMGTTWKVVIANCPEALKDEDLQRQMESRIEDLESQMSHWRDDSVVSAINNSIAGDSHKVTMDMVRVLNESQRLAQLTDGAFDVTAAPLVDAWGFGPSGRRPDLPTEGEIQSALDQVGGARIEIEDGDGQTRRLIVRQGKIRLDLSALAKGYAIDCVAERLHELGVRDFLIELGGELRASGVNTDGKVWRVGLESPTAKATSTGRIRQVVELKNMAVATSGTYRNFVQGIEDSEGNEGGKRLAHIIDPRTGYPIQHGLVSVSVVDKSAMRADAWATALLVLGLDDGFRLAEERSLAATFVSEDGEAEKSTEAFLPFCK